MFDEIGRVRDDAGKDLLAGRQLHTSFQIFHSCSWRALAALFISIDPERDTPSVLADYG
jgi:hypothetical protein